MVTAVCEDLAACPGVEPITVPDNLPADEELGSFRRLCQTCAWTLVIAPETNGILLDRSRLVEEEGGRLLGPTSEAVELAGDKWRLARHLAQHHIPTPVCELLEAEREPALAFPLVCKPRDGAGSQLTFRTRTGDELVSALETARAEAFAGQMIVQPFVAGLAASVAFLIGPGTRLALPAAEQRLSDDGRFRYLGGRLPLPPELDERARHLADRAVAVVPGLRGYVGVDLVLGPTADADVVIEINPRLTTSYIGLRALAQQSLAAAILTVAGGGASPPLTWHQQALAFSAGGVR
jgi:hypothetical protein